jgi:hypothetical protein
LIARYPLVDRLACTLNAEDERHQVPPADVFGHAPRRRRTCHIYTQDEIDHLLRAAAQLTSRRSIQPATFTAFLSLLTAFARLPASRLSLPVRDSPSPSAKISPTRSTKIATPVRAFTAVMKFLWCGAICRSLPSFRSRRIGWSNCGRGPRKRRIRRARAELRPN